MAVNLNKFKTLFKTTNIGGGGGGGGTTYTFNAPLSVSGDKVSLNINTNDFDFTNNKLNLSDTFKQRVDSFVNYDKLKDSLIAGSNIELAANDVAKTITINATITGKDVLNALKPQNEVNFITFDSENLNIQFLVDEFTGEVVSLNFDLNEALLEKIDQSAEKVNFLYNNFNLFNQLKFERLIQEYKVNLDNVVNFTAGSKLTATTDTNTYYLNQGSALFNAKKLPLDKVKIFLQQAGTRATGYISGGGGIPFLLIENLKTFKFFNNLDVEVQPFLNDNRGIVKIELIPGNKDATKYTNKPYYAGMITANPSTESVVKLTLEDNTVIVLRSGYAYNGTADNSIAPDNYSGGTRVRNVSGSGTSKNGNIINYKVDPASGKKIPDQSNGSIVQFKKTLPEVLRANTQHIVYADVVDINGNITKFYTKNTKTANFQSTLTLAQLTSMAPNIAQMGLHPEGTLSEYAPTVSLTTGIRRLNKNLNYIHKRVVEVITKNANEKVVYLLGVGGAPGLAMETYDVYDLEDSTDLGFGLYDSLPIGKNFFHALPVKLLNGNANDNRVAYFPLKRYFSTADTTTSPVKFYTKSIPYNFSGSKLTIDGVEYTFLFNQGKNGQDVYAGQSNGWLPENSYYNAGFVYYDSRDGTRFIQALLDQTQQDAYCFVKFNTDNLLNNTNALPDLLVIEPVVDTFIAQCSNTIFSLEKYLSEQEGILPIDSQFYPAGTSYTYTKNQLKKRILLRNKVEFTQTLDNFVSAGISNGITGKILSSEGKILATGNETVKFDKAIELLFDPATNEFTVIYEEKSDNVYSNVRTIKTLFSRAKIGYTDNYYSGEVNGLIAEVINNILPSYEDIRISPLHYDIRVSYRNAPAGVRPSLVLPTLDRDEEAFYIDKYGAKEFSSPLLPLVESVFSGSIASYFESDFITISNSGSGVGEEKTIEIKAPAGILMVNDNTQEKITSFILGARASVSIGIEAVKKEGQPDKIMYVVIGL